jgi:hypothetical protein
MMYQSPLHHLLEQIDQQSRVASDIKILDHTLTGLAAHAESQPLVFS